MPVEVILPKVDMDMVTGQIARWFVTEGDTVTKGDTLFEIETDKAAMEIDAPASGVIRQITGKERIDIPVGQAVAWIYDEGEAETAADAEPSEPQKDEAPPPVAMQTTTSANVDEIKPGAMSPSGAGRATPLARRLARAAGIDVATIAGSGPHGRVTRTDVEARLAARSETYAPSVPVLETPQPPPPPVQPVTAEADTIRRLFDDDSYTFVPHDSMRRTIARRLVEAKSTIPHFYLSLDCEIEDLLSLRTDLNASAPLVDDQPLYKLSVNDMVIKALAIALRRVADANVSWTETGLLRHKHVDVGVAVSLPGGLITPIVRRADEKTVSAISIEMRDLAARARSRKLAASEYQGGTTSLSNLGMFGIRDFSAIINPPQATILAVGSGDRRAVVRGKALVPATVMSVTLSADHRAVDGALAAEFLATFRRIVEKPLQMLV